jgi:hypothetical protein
MRFVPLALAAAAILGSLSAQTADERAAFRAWLAPGSTAPEGAELDGAIARLLPLLDSPDPELRDDLAFGVLAKWLTRDRVVPVERRRALLATWLGKLSVPVADATAGADAVAGRSFAALCLSLLAAVDNQEPWLTDAEFRQLLDGGVAYLRAETDVRGFDARLGWLHSVAHTADLLRFLARSKRLQPADQAALLGAIGDKLAMVASPLVAGEDERLARVVLALASREDFAADAFAAALASWSRPPETPPSAGGLAREHNRRHLLLALHGLLTAEPRATASLQRARELVVAQLRARGGAPAPAPARATAAPADVASVESLLTALYAAISGAAGEKRDWNRMRSLFHPSARLLPMQRGADGMQVHLLTVDDYVRRAGPALERDGFFEQEVARRVEVFGDFAHAWSTYEARRTQADATPFLRGINSVQFVREGGRWWVLHVLWEQEQDAGPIPAQYLPAK